MKPDDHALDRLFRAAAGAPGTPSSGPSPELQARILAAWHQPPRPDEFAMLLSLFRRGVAVAAIVAAVTVLLSLRGDDAQLPAMDAMVFDSVSELNLLP
jgi:hypothetical protein